MQSEYIKLSPRRPKSKSKSVLRDQLLFSVNKEIHGSEDFKKGLAHSFAFDVGNQKVDCNPLKTHR